MPINLYIINYEQFITEGDNRAGWSGYKTKDKILTEEQYIQWWNNNVNNVDQNNRNFVGHIMINSISKTTCQCDNVNIMNNEITKFKKIQEDKVTQQEIEQAQKAIQQLQEKIKKLTS